MAPSEESDAAIRAASSLTGDGDLIVASNRQPYSHEYDENGEVSVSRPIGGLTAALDPVMQTLHGTWVAWGSGDADRDVTENDRIRVPPEDHAYTLRRVWLDDDQVDGYYYGYSNQTLWPVCHFDLSRAVFSEVAWQHYREVNGIFAQAIVEECSGDEPVIWFQDYHLALAPREVRQRRGSDAFLMHFWHIPWPAWGVLQACPQADELLDGLLANDMIGFHTDDYCRNFLDCVEAALDASIDRSTGRIRYRGSSTVVRSFPLGIDATHQNELAESEAADSFRREFVDSHDLDGRKIAVGVDRLDYTKGIIERLDALERFWETHPEWRGELTYVQKGSKSRSKIPAYQRLQTRIAQRIDEINARFGTDDWRPIVFLTDMLSPEELAGLYRSADLALVSPVRDGMNLVAKEFVASQEDGVLLLSELAGAHSELGESALTIHPNDTSSFVSSIERALTMPERERRRRMRALRQQVHSNTIYDWMEEQFRTANTIQRARYDPISERVETNL